METLIIEVENILVQTFGNILCMSQIEIEI